MILVTGGSGFLGSRLVKKLVQDGHRARAMVIENDPTISNLDGIDCEKVIGDITKPETLKKAMEGIKTVFHLAAVMVSDNLELFCKINYEGTKNVVDAAVGAGVEHFVYISAGAARYKVRTTYGQTKHQAEQLMKEKRSNTNFTIVRPMLVYGPNGGGQEFTMYAEKLREFKLFIPIVGDGSARKRFVLIDDIIKGLSLVADNPITYGKTYHFGGKTVHTMREATEMICKQLGINKPIIPVPAPICYAMAHVLKLVQKKPLLKRDTILGVIMDADWSIEEAQKDLGYNPIGFEEGVKTVFPHSQALG